MKKICSWILVLSFVFSVLFQDDSVTTIYAAANLKSIYTKYVKQEMKKGTFPEKINCYMYDFNKDGVKELIVVDIGGARALLYVYTYTNGKVKYLTDGNDIGYIKGKKYLVSYGSGGANNFGYDVYKISDGKLKKAFSYHCVDGVYKKNNKKISKEEFAKFEKQVVYKLGTGFEVSKYTYYSAKQIGFSFNKVFKPEDIVIDKVTNDKISYHIEKWDPETGDILSKGKKKSAKITKDTKFYYGDTQLYFSGKLSGTEDQKKWLKKISKSEFLQIMKTYKDAPNVINLKNGKATSIVINIHIAD